MRKPRVYIAGPITSSGNLTENVRTGILTMRQLYDLGFVPFCPHLSELVNMVRPMSWDHWLDFDRAWITVCDAIFRLPGFSKGADAEEVYAGGLGIPVLKDLNELLRWKDSVFYSTLLRTSKEVGQ